MINNCLKQVDRKKACELLVGITGIYTSYLIVGIMYEKITNNRYLNSNNQQLQPFRITSGYILIERAIIWILGLLYRNVTLPKEQRVTIDVKSSASTGFMIWLSNITQTEAMYFVSFPLIVMAKSCSLINVILVGVCCSRVRSKQLKLGNQKIMIAILVTIGILTFRYFDPATNLNNEKSTQIMGLVLLSISLFADGFTPDFQAQIKQKSNPSSIEMLVVINMWSAIFALIHLILRNELKDLAVYCFEHPEFVWDLLTLTFMAFIGQMFIYRMIKAFKQHVVPFVVTTRKIFTVGLSIVYFHHDTSVGQVLSIVLVLMVTIYEFLDNIRKGQQPPIREINELDEEEMVELPEIEVSDKNRFHSMRMA